MNHYTLFCHGFDEQQTTSITAILNLAESALSASWRIINQSDADVVVINQDSETGNESYASYLKKLPSYRIVLVSKDTSLNQEDVWFLHKKSHAPPSLRELVDLFNQLAVCLIEEAKKTASTLEKAVADKVEESIEAEIEKNSAVVEDETIQINAVENDVIRKKVFTELDYLFGLVIQAKKNNRYSIVTFKKLPPIFLLPGENEYFFSGSTDDLDVYCLAERDALGVQVLTRAKLKKAIKNHKKGKYFCLRDLASFAVIKATQGRLLKGYSETDIVKLKKFPDIKKIPSLYPYRIVAELMIDQEIDLLSASEKLNIPVSELFKFANACAILGYLEKSTPKNENDTRKESKNKKTLSRYLTSFFKK